MASILFTRGAPSLDIIDQEGLREAAQKAFTDDPGGTFAYGTSVGYVPLRQWLAEQHGVEPEQVLVTNGSMQADAFLFEIHAIELETDGINVDALEQLLESGVRPSLAHIIPNFHNPAGYTLSEAKRARLLDLAAKYDFVLFEDDPYIKVRFEGEPLPTMLSQDENEKVVYASSFSKTMAPGIRCGYLVGPKTVIKKIQDIATTTYISPNMVAQSIVNSYCRSGRIEESIVNVRTALRARRDALVTALKRELPEAVFTAPQGGYFMWVELPGVSIEKLFGVAKEHGVEFVKGSDFLLEGGDNAMRLAFSGVTPEQIDEGITRLAAAVRSLS
jgi:2-aminoadipate transaminase